MLFQSLDRALRKCSMGCSQAEQSELAGRQLRKLIHVQSGVMQVMLGFNKRWARETRVWSDESFR